MKRTQQQPRNVDAVTDLTRRGCQFRFEQGMPHECPGQLMISTNPQLVNYWSASTLQASRTLGFTICAIPGHRGIARRARLVMNSKTLAAGSLGSWWIGMPSFRRKICCLQRLELSAIEGKDATCWICHVFVTLRKTKGLRIHASPCFIWLLDLGSNQGPTD